MKEKLIYLIEAQDIFKTPFQFLFRGRRNIHCPFGMLLSLLINLSSFCLLITLLSELLNHSKPSVSYAKLHSSMTTNLTLNTKEFLFTIAFRDNNYNIIKDPSIASIIATYEKTVLINGNLKKETINLNFMNCSNIYPLFKKFRLDDRFNNSGLINYNCYNYSEPIIIGGKNGTDFYANLAFYITKCRNSSDSNISCKSEEEINNLIQNGFLQITYVSSYVDINNFSHPIQYVTEDTYIMFDVLMNKKIDIHFSSLEIHSENNIIFSIEKKEISTKHDVTTTDFISVLENGILSSIMIYPSFNVEKYYRRYIKIQEIGASIGGLYSGLTIISVILSSYHKYRYTEMKIINEIFTFGSEKIIKDKYSLFKIQPLLKFDKNISNISDNNINSFFKNNNKATKEKKFIFHLPIKLNSNPFSVIGQESKFNKMYYYKIDIGFCNSIRLMFCCCKSETRIYSEHRFAFKELLKYIDYIEVSKFFMDVEKIKSILKTNHISDKWISHTKLITLNVGKNDTKDISKMFNYSTVLLNSNMLLGGENKTSDILDIFKK